MNPTAWMDDAACGPRPEHPWSAETTPALVELHLMAAICWDCPARRACAGYALDTNAERGMYAGVWIPVRRTPVRGAHVSKRWRIARDRLGAVAQVVA